MDEDTAVKAPVTRLRRRLSVEQSDEVGSPQTPLTPNKKRGRLAAKPLLDNIDENAPVNSPRRKTRNSIAKEITTDAPEEKVLTPARRSTRIKSNTSLTSESIQTYESPRARRTSRRNSLLGSDTETTTTPTKARRTRKNSNVNNQTEVNQSIQLTDETIPEEALPKPNNSLNSSKSESKTPRKSIDELNPNNLSPRSLRKSRRIAAKRDSSLNNSLGESNDQAVEEPMLIEQTQSNASSMKKRKTRPKSMSSISENDSQERRKSKLNHSLNSKLEKSSQENKENFADLVLTAVKNKMNKAKAAEESQEKDKTKTDIHTVEEEKKTNVSVSSFSNDNNEINVNLDDKNNEDDQCVPVVCNDMDKDMVDSGNLQVLTQSPSKNESSSTLSKSLLKTASISMNVSNSNQLNNSSEPMEVDDSIYYKSSQQNISLDKNTSQVSQQLNTSVKNQSTSSLSHKSPKKRMTQDSLDAQKLSLENKSTLILSQLEDSSTNELKNKSRTSKGETSLKELGETKLLPQSPKTDNTPSKNNLKNLGMQTSTPVTIIKKLAQTKNNKTTPKQKSVSNDEDSSNSDSSAEDMPFVNNEAEEADNDYESGDSRDESSRRYEEENEIIERGETLSSNEDISNDSDYEKGSFVVSSDEEDNELMSGTGDDLSMSDNELTMSSKSKKKYNERKNKEQKEASREMYESRHKLKNKSISEDESPRKSKKVRQRLDSSLLTSDEDKPIEIKKKNIVKLDSTQEDESDTNEAFKTKRKNSKRNSMSIDNEMEISATINESIINKNDPLVAAIKTEPKTPLKEFNTSTVNIVPEVEEMQIDENITIINNDESLDPLHINNTEEDSSSSENEEITQNYDSVLKCLNEKSKFKIKDSDTSLNLDKKSKSKQEPLIDQLNLTLTKPQKVSKKSNPKQKVSLEPVNSSGVKDDDESSSDGIDLKLLFPDNDSENSSEETKNNEPLSESSNEDDSYIPLRKTEAKIDIRKEDDDKINQSLNTSKNKTKSKKNTTLNQSVDAVDNPEKDVSMKENTRAEGDDRINQSLNTSRNKKKAKKNTILNQSAECLDTFENTRAEDDDKNNQSLNTSKNKKNNKLDQSVNRSLDNVEKDVSMEENTGAEDDVRINQSLNTSKNKKKTKKTNKLESVNQCLENENDVLMEGSTKTEGTIQNKKSKKSFESANSPQVTKEEEKTQLKSSKEIDICAQGDSIAVSNINMLNSYMSKREVQTKDETNNVLNRKRKFREDSGTLKAKVQKGNFLNNINIARLPSFVLNQLEDGNEKSQSSNVVATSTFTIEPAKKRRNKPSTYLEDSILLHQDHSPEKRKEKKSLRIPKVLPFVPTATISSSGFTTNFKVSIIPRETKFITQGNAVTNFKQTQLSKNIKKLGTYEQYRKQRSAKLTKF